MRRKKFATANSINLNSNNKNKDKNESYTSVKFFSSLLNVIKNAYLYLEWTPITIIRELVVTFSRISGWTYISLHLVAQAFFLYVGNAILYSLNRVLIENYQSLSESFQNFSKNGKTDLENGVNDHWVVFQNKIYEVAPFLVYYIVSTSINHFVNKYFTKRLVSRLEDDLNRKRLSNQTAYGMTHDKENDFISKNLSADTKGLTSNGTEIMTSSFTAAQNAITSFAELITYSTWINIGYGIKVPDLLASSAIYGFTTQYVSSFLSNLKTHYNNEIQKLKINNYTIINHDNNYIKTLTERNGEEFTAKRYKALQDNVRELETKQLIVSSVYSAWDWGQFVANRIFKIYTIGRKLYNQTLEHKNRGDVFHAIDNVEPFFEWRKNNSDLITECISSQKRINQFLEERQKLLDKPKTLETKFSENRMLSINNFCLKIGNDRLLVNIPSIQFDLGKRYLITGDSGNGKSTLLAKIAGIVNTGEINATGTITEPKFKGKPFKKVMLTQSDYFPKNTTLLEAICFPDTPPKDVSKLKELKSVIIHLLKESNIDNVKKPFIAEPELISINAIATSFNNDLKEHKTLTLNNIIKFTYNLMSKIIETIKYIADIQNIIFILKVGIMGDNKVINKPKNDNSKGPKLSSIIDLLDETEDWDVRLSGGQKKKIQIISQIIKNPDILILDEAFTGLDKGSIATMHKMLMKYLPNTMMLVVDHHGVENNKLSEKEFCQEHYHFANHKVEKIAVNDNNSKHADKINSRKYSYAHAK